MKQTRIRIYRNDGDTLEICETLHEQSGRCSFFHREKVKDVIAVCFCENLRMEPEKIFPQKRLE